MVSDTDIGTTRKEKRLLAVVLGCLIVGVISSPLLPRISLDTALADGIVRLTDTANWGQMTPITVVVIAILITRPGLPGRSRIGEAASLSLVMLIALAGNALLNEQIIKPAFGVPRPNIVFLAETGVLGPDLPDAAAFYASGDKQARRTVLGDRLTEQTTPQLSSRVRAHWIHETGYAFPSGHTTAAVTFAVLLAAIALHWLSGWRRIAMLYLVPTWAIAVAGSRTLLEVHTGWDVVGGAVAGLAWGGLAFSLVYQSLSVTAQYRRAPREAPTAGSRLQTQRPSDRR
jgi:phosphatidylglycerophosphatase B